MTSPYLESLNPQLAMADASHTRLLEAIRATWEGAEFFSFIHPWLHAEVPLSPEMPQVLQGAGQGVPGQGDSLGNG